MRRARAGTAAAQPATSRRVPVAAALLGSLVIGLLWGGILFHLALRESSAITQGYQDANNLSVALKEEAERTLAGVGQVLRFIAVDRKDRPESFDFTAWERRSDSLRDVTVQMGITDGRGDIKASSLAIPEGNPVNVSHREYFRTHADGADKGLFVSQATFGRLSKVWGFQLSRRLENADGTFAGIVFATIDIALIAKHFAELDVGSDGSVALIGKDGFVRARWPFKDGIYDLDLRGTESGKQLFSMIDASGAGAFRAGSAVDGAERIFGYRSLRSLPLVVAVGLSTAEVLAPVVLERQRAYILGGLATSVVVALFAALMYELERRRRRQVDLVSAHRALAATEADARRAEAEARSLNQYLLIAEGMAHVGYWRIDVPSLKQAWSPEIFRIYGLAPAPAAPTLDESLLAFHPDDRPVIQQCIAEAVRDECPFEFELRLVRPSGEVRTVTARADIERETTGIMTAIFGVFVDVTEIKRAEREAREANRLLLLAEQIAQVGHWRLEVPANAMTWSDGVYRMHGFHRDSYRPTAGKSVAAYHPDDQSEVRRSVTQAIADRGSCEFNLRLMRADGEVRQVLSRGLCEIGPAGDVTAIFGTIMDVTDMRRAELAVATSEARYRLLADNASDLIVLGHADGRRSYISPAVRTLLGYTVEEAHGLRLRECLHPDDIDQVFAATAGLTAERPTASVVHRIRHKEGHYIWVEAVFQRVQDRCEVNTIAALRDVTQRQRQAVHLERAMLAAEAAGKVKAEFLANMSHELRTPLTGMLGVHDLLESDPGLSAQQARLVAFAQDSGRSLLAIVNDILDFSKIEAGQMTIEAVPFSLPDLLTGCRQLAAGNLRTKSVTLILEAGEAGPELLIGDPTRLRQILLNLVMNAIKFTTAGEVRIRSLWRPDGRLRLEVEDTGIGIAPDVIPHLFERFSQADGSTARRFGGTGLGLAICKRLVELMDGAIGVESAPGRGSTFWFEVPLLEADADRRLQGRAGPLPAISGRSHRILVAEDNEINQEIVRTVLERQGHRVTVVADGSAAVETFAREPFDVVLMDVQMPRMDGLVATAEIRAFEVAEGRTRCPVVALTANVMAEEGERCRSAGMDAHVAKPIDWAGLFSIIDRLCARHEVLAGAEAAGLPDGPPVLDESALHVLAGIVGRERIGELLASFRRETDRRLGLMSAAATAKEVADHAHALVAAAGQLGFAELSAECVDLDRQPCPAEDPGRMVVFRSVAARAIAAAETSSYAKAA